MDPITREEKYLNAILSGDTSDLPTPITRVEMYLYDIAVNGGGGGGTTNYNALNNKPQIGGVTLQGDKSLSDLGIEQIQVSTMPEASVEYGGKIVQYIGTTDTYTNGYFYKCVENDGVYSWEASDTQAHPTSNTFNEDDFNVVSNEVSLKPARRTFVGTRLEWEALSSEQKALYEMVALTDDEDADYRDVYSTSEVKTNKVWIDGKPIYRKTFTTTIPSSISSYVALSDVTLGNVGGTVIKVSWTMRNSVGAWITGNPCYGGANFYYDTAAGSIYIENGLNWFAGLQIHITLEYTKTTD